jgi:hypothetical protein
MVLHGSRRQNELPFEIWKRMYCWHYLLNIMRRLLVPHGLRLYEAGVVTIDEEGEELGVYIENGNERAAYIA